MVNRDRSRRIWGIPLTEPLPKSGEFEGAGVESGLKFPKSS